MALLPESRLLPLLVAVLVFGWLWGRPGLRVLLSRRFWLFLLTIVAVAVLILGETDLRWSVFCLSRQGLTIGLWMALRAVTLTLAFSVSVGALSVAQLVRLFDGVGLRGLGFALGVALNLGPVLRDTVEAAYHTLRLRGGLRRPLRAAQLFVVTTISNALRYGDDVVKAASARAFDPNARLSWSARLVSRADWVFVAGLITLGAGLLVL